jgi:hypothetical protein
LPICYYRDMTEARQRVFRAVPPLRQGPAQGARPKYQLFPDLAPAEFEALRADIAKRGVLIPVEVDEEGNTCGPSTQRPTSASTSAR